MSSPITVQQGQFSCRPPHPTPVLPQVHDWERKQTRQKRNRRSWRMEKYLTIQVHFRPEGRSTKPKYIYYL